MNRRLLILLSILTLATSAAARADVLIPVDGSWQKHEDMFTFTGLTAHYSCIGLEQKMKRLLRLVGARPGFKVEGGCADAPGAPPATVVLRLRFETLAPAGGAPAGGGEAGVGAWRVVNWGALASRDLEAADCQLVEQFAHEILPMFATRDLQSHMNCLPNQADLSGIRLSFSVLGAAPSALHFAVAKTQ